MLPMWSGSYAQVSVLNREPMGMKHGITYSAQPSSWCVSVLNREPMGMKQVSRCVVRRLRASFQCSTASRWG